MVLRATRGSRIQFGLMALVISTVGVYSYVGGAWWGVLISVLSIVRLAFIYLALERRLAECDAMADALHSKLDGTG